MAKVLVIRKTDKTISTAPLANKPALMALNSRAPLEKRMKFEEMEEEEAAKLPWKDDSFVSPLEAQDRLSEVRSELSDKDKRIKELELMIANLSKPIAPANIDQGKPTLAGELVEMINAAPSAAVVNALAENDTRVTVLAAKVKRLKELQANG